MIINEAMERTQVSAVIPLLNEKHVDECLSSLTDSLLAGNLSYEIILVDDGSSAEIAISYEELARRYPHVKIVRHEYNMGQSAAILSGLKVSAFEKILILPGDLKVGPDDIFNMMAMLDDGHDVVFGVRNRVGVPLRRRLLSAFLNSLVSVAGGRLIQDIGSGFYLLSRKLADQVVAHQSFYEPLYRPMNIATFFLAGKPAQTLIQSQFIRRKSRYSSKRLVLFTLMVLRYLMEYSYRSATKVGSYLTSQNWSEIAQKIETSLGNADFDYFRRDKLLCYDEFYAIGRASRVLDVGCGPGHFVVFCAEKGCDVTGIDSSRGMVNLASKRLAQKNLSAHLMQVDISGGLPFKNGAFDAVACESVLNHVGNPQQVVEEIERVLKPGGHAIIDVSNRWGFFWRISILASQISGSYPKGYIHWISPIEAEHLVESAGFQVLKRSGLHLIPPPRPVSIDFRTSSLLSARFGAKLERFFFRLNNFLERRPPFLYLCFKYLVYCGKV